MIDSTNSFPARPLFSLAATDMAQNRLRVPGPMGVRTVASPTGGEFRGERLRGSIGPGLASEWQIESAAMPELAFVEGLITLLGSEGGAILVKYAGRRSPRYGASGWRVCACFEAPSQGAYDWLNDIVAVAVVTQDRSDLCFTFHELLGRARPVDRQALKVEPLYEMVAGGAVGERHIVKSPIATRYLTVAEEGCRTNGQLIATWPVGFAWGPHRTARTEAGEFTLPVHIDMRAGLVADNGEALVQSYLGVTSRATRDSSPGADQSWITVAMFEAPMQGPLSHLNEILALGVGWAAGEQSFYNYRTWM